MRNSCREVAQIYGNGKPLSSVLAAKTIAAVERMARADRCHATAIEQWDANDWLWNAAGETIDLHSGSGHMANPNDYITKIAACDAAPPGTPHPIWSVFLERIAPDPELRGFLQRFAGYCLTGDTSEHKFVFLYGTGANGKGTFVNTLAGILGDYADHCRLDLHRQQQRAPPDRPRQATRRPPGRGAGDRERPPMGRDQDQDADRRRQLTARFMRCDFFDFVPKFKLVIVGNHKPRLDNVDEAMRRRLFLVPFLVQIPAAERDPGCWRSSKRMAGDPALDDRRLR